MRKLIVAVMTSLDGVIQAPGGPDEDRSGGFAHGGWVWPHAGDGEVMGGVFSRPFDLVLGRRTYDIFANYWPQVPSDAPHGHIADAFNNATKHVATYHPDTLAWRNSRALGTDPVAALRELKRGEGPDLVTQGSSDLLHQLLAADVVDELRLLVYPVLLGDGKRLFDAGTRASALRLASSATTSAGVLVTHYLRDGEVRTGAFAGH
ncbi:dihydrofolate reductase family protein [Pseudoxanthomonas sp. PXM03]|uniref:dihydrofolate reductase family protein n=1 Tax=Pseudoxanthomonas sp. PXM03 TaxID=2769284 RepID=UPI00177A8BBF|nr:dihydrofolate reductase family protein [Pseudoxanthomonas sp. PXM03]MBD9435959.1 dihydrofolate reductase family protein [Pseudoxanthomonas sp. PXM03]